MKRPLFPPSIAAVFFLSMAYWLYLGFFTRMMICWDSIDYRDLGLLIYDHGYLAYFKTGPHREALYPSLIAVSMALEQITGLAFTKIMAIFGVIIMLLTQALSYKIMRLLNIRTGINALVLGYLAISPALNNSAFSLFSEIITYPFILGILLTGFFLWDAVKKDKGRWAFFYSVLLGILLTLSTLIKGVFECIAPVYLIILFASVIASEAKQSFKKIATSPTAALKSASRKDTKRITTLLLCIAAAVSSLYIPVTAYKLLNLHYNGYFTVTNRGSWQVYGNTARNMGPLTFKKLGAALAYAPGEGVCNSIWGQQECAFWSFQKADEFGMTKLKELNGQHLSVEKIDSSLISMSIQKAGSNPFQYALLAAINGSKMFFWESTQIGFVSYPHWLQRIYDIKVLDNALRFIVSLMTLIAVFSIWAQVLSPQKPPLVFLLGVLIFIYIFFFTFVSILTRYALPIAPLYMIAIGIWLNQNLPLKKID